MGPAFFFSEFHFRSAGPGILGIQLAGQGEGRERAIVLALLPVDVPLSYQKIEIVLRSGSSGRLASCNSALRVSPSASDTLAIPTATAVSSAPSACARPYIRCASGYSWILIRMSAAFK